jgi:hypothetical protein
MRWGAHPRQGSHGLATETASRGASVRARKDCVVDLAAFIDRYDQAWNEQDVEAIMSMHTSDMVFENTSDMVFENHTRAVRAEGAAVRELLESTFTDQPDLRFRGRERR